MTRLPEVKLSVERLIFNGLGLVSIDPGVELGVAAVRQQCRRSLLWSLYISYLLLLSKVKVEGGSSSFFRTRRGRLAVAL